jgi:hypothetical protein
MKTSRHFFLFVFISISISASAQFSKGDRLIGGNLNAYFSNYNSTGNPNPPNIGNQLNTSLTPRYSWVSNDNVMNGIFLSGGYGRSKTSSSTASNEQISNSYSIGAGYFIRKFKDFNQQFGWFIEYNGLVSYRRSENKDLSSSFPYNPKFNELQAGVNVIPGLYYKVTPKAVIEATFGGIYANYGRAKSQSAVNRYFNIGLNFPASFSFGVQFLFNNKQSQK